MEVKRIGMEWYEKLDDMKSEFPTIDELLDVDKDLAECDNILSEIGLQTGYSRYENRICDIWEKRVHLRCFIMNLPTCIDVYLDEPFRQKLNHGASEIISRIHMADFQVENTLGLTVKPVNREYWRVPQVKDKLNLEDFIGSALGENAEGNRIPGTNHDCVEEFAVIFQQQYDNLLAMGMLGEDSQKLEEYLDQFVSQGEHNHKEDQPFSKLLLTNLLDLTIIKPIIESCCGYDLITKEDLTDMERSLKLVFAIVDLVTLATGLYGFTLAAETMGAKEAVTYFVQLALVELAADVSATTVATIGEYCEWPAGLTILLSLGTGLTVGQVGNHLIFEQNGIEIFRKEVSESGGLLSDLMSPEDAEKFQKFWEEGSTAGLTPEELAGIRKVDDYLALNKVQYDDVLALRKKAIENSTGVFDEVPWEELMSPEEAAGLCKFWEEGSTAGLTPEEMAGIRKVDDYLALNKVKYDEVLALRKGAIEDSLGLERGSSASDIVNNPKEVNIHGNINSELDEVDLINKIIFEDKNASRLYMDNLDFPQTEAQWAYKHIYQKGSNRIIALQQTDFTLSGSGSLPDVELLKDIKEYVFRIDADTPELRAAVQRELNNLKETFPDYNFSAIFGGKQ